MERKAQSFSHACRIRELWRFEEVGQPLPYLPYISLFKVTLHLPWTFDMSIPVAGIRIREPEGQRSEREGEELGARRGWHSERKGMVERWVKKLAACAQSLLSSLHRNQVETESLWYQKQSSRNPSLWDRLLLKELPDKAQNMSLFFKLKRQGEMDEKENIKIPPDRGSIALLWVLDPVPSWTTLNIDESAVNVRVYALQKRRT